VTVPILRIGCAVVTAYLLWVWHAPPPSHPVLSGLAAAAALLAGVYCAARSWGGVVALDLGMASVSAWWFAYLALSALVNL
jgi:hypothetical protein